MIKYRMMNRALVLTMMIGVALNVGARQYKGTLTADGNNAETYSLIERSGFGYEVPDMSRQHKDSPFQHIQQKHDEELGKDVFVFILHSNIDDDRGKKNINDRQRCEIKTYNKSPEYTVGQQGDRMIFKWKFKLPEGLKTTKKFCHIHQLKGIDNKSKTAAVGRPLITLTCCTKRSEQVMQLRWHNRQTEKYEYIAETDLKPFLGQWIEAEEKVTIGEEGLYRLTLKDRKGKTLYRVERKGIDMWRTDCAGVRPQWGIYRSVGENRMVEDSLRDEEVLFADFSIIKKGRI